jgi:hypothetical protein
VRLDALSSAPEDISRLSYNAPEYNQHPSDLKNDPINGALEVIPSVEDPIQRPTEEERTSLRRVAGKIPWICYTLRAVEFAERASYYGCSGVFSNFVEFPLP